MAYAIETREPQEWVFPYLEVLSGITDGVIVADSTGRMQFCNPAAEKLLGIGQSNSDPDKWSAEYGILLADGTTTCPTEKLPLVRALHGEKVDDTELVISNSVIGVKKRVSARAGPIVDETGALVGGVVTFHDTTARYDAEEQVRQQAAKLAELNAELERLSETDILTGLTSRGAFDLTLTRAIEGTQSNAGLASLMILDVDYFKSINDSHGHLAGDNVLCQLADLIREQAGDDQFPARIGGEEFAIILHSQSLQDAACKAEKLRQQIEHDKFLYQGQELRVTVSIGVAQVSSDDDNASFFQRADLALYSAKNSGRNSVWISDCSGVCSPITEEGKRVKSDLNISNRRSSARTKVPLDKQNVVVNIHGEKIEAKLKDESVGGFSMTLSEIPGLRLGDTIEISRDNKSYRAIVRNMGIASDGIWRVGLAWDNKLTFS